MRSSASCDAREQVQTPSDSFAFEEDVSKLEGADISVTSPMASSLVSAVLRLLWGAVLVLIGGALVFATVLAVISLVAAPMLAVGGFICERHNGREEAPISLPNPNQSGLNHYLFPQLGT